jgi:hypothetical protein
MQNIDNGKTRVNSFTKIDKTTDSLLEDLYFTYFIFGLIFIVIGIAFKLYFLAFGYFLYFFTFNLQKNLSKSKSKEEIVKDLSLTFNDNLKDKYSVHLGTIVKKHKKDIYNLTFFNKIKKFFGLDYEVEKIIQSQILTSSKNNAITPALIDDKTLREHCALVATSGGGKTELLLNSYIDSSTKRGAGVFAVFGKADNVVLQRAQSIAAKYKRLSDVIIYDFNEDKQGKTNSNSLNIFELGKAKNIITMLTNIADFENDTWGKSAKSYLSEMLKVVLTLRDADFFIDVSKINQIYESNDKFEEYVKHIKPLDYFGFSRLISEIDLLLKFLLIFDDMYANNRNKINQMLYSKYTKIIEDEVNKNNSLAYLNSEEKNQFHIELKQTVIMQSNVPTWEKLSNTYINGVKSDDDETIYGMEALSIVYPQRSGTFYTLTESISAMKNIFEFFNSFASILKNQHNDINILDAIDSNKIVIVNLPGQNKVYAPVLAELIVSTLNLLAERRGKDYKPDITTLVILDEINSWLKTKKDKSFDIGDILSVIRGLYMGAVLSFQSSLKETLGSVDSSQVFANVKTIVTLKLEDDDVLEQLNKKVKKVEELQLEESLQKNKTSKKSQPEDKKFTKSKEDYFKPEMLSKIKNGEGYIIRNSTAQPFMAKYLSQEPLYKTEIDEVLLNKYVSEEIILKKRNELLREMQLKKEWRNK